MAHPDMDATPKPKHAVVRRALSKLSAMNAGMTIKRDELSHREYKTITLIKSKYNEAAKNHRQ